MSNIDLILEPQPSNEEIEISVSSKKKKKQKNEDETVQDMYGLMNNNIDSATIPMTPVVNSSKKTNFPEVFSSNKKSMEETPKQLQNVGQMKKDKLINEMMERENSNDDARRKELKKIKIEELRKTLTAYRNRRIDSY